MFIRADQQETIVRRSKTKREDQPEVVEARRGEVMEVTVDENDMKAAGAQPLEEGRCGLRIRGWEIESRKRSILNSSSLLEYFPSLLTSAFHGSVAADKFSSSC